MVKVYREGLFITALVILIPAYLFVPSFMVQFLCLFFLCIVVLSRLYTGLLVRNIGVIRRDAELREFKQQWVRVELVLENRGYIPAFLLALSDTPGMLPLFKGNKSACSLPRRSRLVHVWEGYCSERGRFTLGPAMIRGSDPLGLFPFQIRSAETAALFVYPAPAHALLKAPSGVPLGVLLSRNALYEDISRTRSLRPYQNGDEPRRINWKASARLSTGERHPSLMVNEYEATVSFPLMVFLNLDANAYPLKKGNAFMERAIEAAAALCLSSSREAQDAGIIIFSPQRVDIVSPARFALVPILERLSLAEYGERDGTGEAGERDKAAGALLEKAKQLPFGTRVLYVGPDLADGDYIRLSVLRRFHLTLEYLIIAEHSLSAAAPGNAPRYILKESGYEIT
jgi:uncharacterized protein (DUF58 family)